jgi:hypothetical protein
MQPGPTSAPLTRLHHLEKNNESPCAVKLDRCLSQFPALQTAIERYEEIPARRSLLIVAVPNGGINTIAQNLSLLARACLSVGILTL